MVRLGHDLPINNLSPTLFWGLGLQFSLSLRRPGTRTLGHFSCSIHHHRMILHLSSIPSCDCNTVHIRFESGYNHVSAAGVQDLTRLFLLTMLVLLLFPHAKQHRHDRGPYEKQDQGPVDDRSCVIYNERQHAHDKRNMEVQLRRSNRMTARDF